jgi:hypothetical protein
MFYYDERGVRHERIGRFTSVPGLYYQARQFGDASERNPRGTRTISTKEGQYKAAYYQGTHIGSKPQPKAMRQNSKIPYTQDKSLNSIYNNNGSELAKNGTNIHNSGIARPNDPKKLIDNWSAGCQVFRNIADFH